MSSPTAAAYGATLRRVALGSLFPAHLWLKPFVFTPAGTAGFFDNPNGGREHRAFRALALVALPPIGDGAHALRFSGAASPVPSRSLP